MPPWTIEQVRALLLDAGFAAASGDLLVEPRDGRTMARLPGDLMAWFADDERGQRLLDSERRVLRLLEARCAFHAPRVVYVARDGTFDVRAAVPGECDPWKLYALAKADRRVGERIGADLGAILAEQHTRVVASDVAAWLPSRPSWPEPSAWIRERVARVVGDRGLLREIDEVLDSSDAVVVSDADRVLVHGDVGLHNIAVDPVISAVRGIFDYAGAAWSDRHYDFRYLVFDRGHDEMLDAALAVYEPATRCVLSRDRVALYNAAAAACFLAFRAGIPADQRSCGRTLDEDLAWIRWAIEAAAGAIVA